MQLLERGGCMTRSVKKCRGCAGKQIVEIRWICLDKCLVAGQRGRKARKNPRKVQRRRNAPTLGGQRAQSQRREDSNKSTDFLAIPFGLLIALICFMEGMKGVIS